MHPDVGQRIKEARQKAGLTQEQLGEAIGKGRVALVRWEAGAPFQTDLLAEMAKHLNVSPEWIMFGNKAPTAAVSPEVVHLITNAKRLVSETVGFGVTDIQAIEWIATKAGLRNDLFSDGDEGGKNKEGVESAES